MRQQLTVSLPVHMLEYTCWLRQTIHGIYAVCWIFFRRSNCEIIFKEFQLVWSQSTNVTDGQTTYHTNTALCVLVSGYMYKLNSRLSSPR